MSPDRQRTCLPRLRRPARPQRLRGFTLLEMLVVVALLSLVMLGLASSFFSLGQTESRVDARLDQASQLRASMHFLDQTLGRVVTRFRPGVQNVQESRYWFDGNGQAMRWVGIMPARYGAGGRYFFQLAVEGDALVIRFAPWQDIPQFPDPSQMDARVLLTDVVHFSIQYRGEEADSIDWSDGWNFPYQLPSHVMLNMVTTRLALPVKIVAMRQSGESQLRATVGGGR